MAEKTVNVKQAEKPRQVVKARKAAEKAVKPADRDKVKKPNAIQRWYRETVGELRKVSWPTLPETRRLTVIVLLVMFAMSLTLGLLDFLFSRLISLLVI